MATRLNPRQITAIASLTAIWCGLWGSASAANIFSGLAVAWGAFALGFGPPSRLGIRLSPLVRLAWLVGVDLAKSTLHVAAEVLTPTDRTAEAIVAVHVPPVGRAHFLLLVVAITLTPGTAVVDTDIESGVLYVHLLHHGRRSQTIAHVERLARLAADALSPQPRNAAV